MSSLAFLLSWSAKVPFVGAIIGFMLGVLGGNSDNHVYLPLAGAVSGAILGALLGPVIGFILLCHRDNNKK